MKYTLMGLSIACALAVSYYFGAMYAPQSISPSVPASPSSIAEIDQLESNFDQQQEVLANRLDDLRNKVETINLNLGAQEQNGDVSQVEIDDALKALNSKLERLKADEVNGPVPIPADSPSGRVQNQPRTASGIAVSVLENYEKETGVTPQEIEELMQREH